jgi:putative membrane protein
MATRHLVLVRRVRGHAPVVALCGALIVMPLAGCASADNDVAGEVTATGTTGTTGAHAAKPAGATGDTAADTAAQTAAQLSTATGAQTGTMTEGEILAVVHTANQAEVQASHLALQRAMAPEVRDYARQMVDRHSKANQRVEEAAAATEPPIASERATTVAEEGNAVISSLSAQSGSEFDRAYVESQLKMHQDVLDTIDNELLPAAQDSGVRQLLESLREDVESHLAEAQELQQRMASTAG